MTISTIIIIMILNGSTESGQVGLRMDDWYPGKVVPPSSKLPHQKQGIWWRDRGHIQPTKISTTRTTTIAPLLFAEPPHEIVDHHSHAFPPGSSRIGHNLAVAADAGAHSGVYVYVLVARSAGAAGRSIRGERMIRARTPETIRDLHGAWCRLMRTLFLLRIRRRKWRRRRPRDVILLMILSLPSRSLALLLNPTLLVSWLWDSATAASSSSSSLYICGIDGSKGNLRRFHG